MRKRETIPNPSWFKKGEKRVITDIQRKKISESELGDKNPNWKGDKVKYRQLHKWVRSRKPIPVLCNKCGEKKKLQLSNIERKYTRDLENWEYLCVKCHVYKDGTVYNLKNVRKLKGLGSRKLDSSLAPRILELEITIKINGEDCKFIKK